MGGNCTTVTLFDAPRRSNLHSAWDSGIIRHSLKESHQTADQMAMQIDERYQVKGRKWLHDRIDFPAWLWQAHELATKITYGKLARKVPIGNAEEGPSCDAEKQATAALNIQIDEKYASTAMPVIERQLAKAGYRLADLLNAAF